MPRKCLIVTLAVLILFIIPCFPFVVCWVIDLINQLLFKYNMKFVLEISYPLSISIGDYVSIISSLLSCYVAGIIGWITYKLSLAIAKHDQQSEKTLQVIIQQNIKDEIYKNLEIIVGIQNKVHDNNADIQMKQYTWVVDSNNLQLLFKDAENQKNQKSCMNFLKSIYMEMLQI